MRERLVFRFDPPHARFEGRVLGVLERAATGEAIHVVEAIYVGRDETSGELEATRITGGAGGLVTALTDFRLDAERRRHLTEEALSGEAAEMIRNVGADLVPGSALIAIVVDHVWHTALVDAAAQSGGRPVVDEVVS